MAEPGQVAYEAVGGVSAISGDPLPTWEQQCTDRPQIADARRASARAVQNIEGDSDV